MRIKYYIVHGSLFFLLQFSSCSPVYMRYSYSVNSAIEHIEISFGKKVVTERRVVKLPCQETFVVEKKALYSKNTKGIIRIDSIISSSATNSYGKLLEIDSVIKNTCLDSVVNAYAEYNNKNFRSRRLDSISDRDFIIKRCFYRSFLNTNDTIVYSKQFPKYIANPNAWIGCADSIVDVNDCVQFLDWCSKHIDSVRNDVAGTECQR